MQLYYLVLLNRLVCSSMACSLSGCSYAAHNGCGITSVMVYSLSIDLHESIVLLLNFLNVTCKT